MGQSRDCLANSDIYMLELLLGGKKSPKTKSETEMWKKEIIKQ